MKKYAVLILFIFFLILPGLYSSNSVSNTNNSKQGEIPDSTESEFIDTLALFILDGKEINQKEAIPLIVNEKITCIEGLAESQDAVFNYGEKARYGIYIFVTKEPLKKIK